MTLPRRWFFNSANQSRCNFGLWSEVSTVHSCIIMYLALKIMMVADLLFSKHRSTEVLTLYFLSAMNSNDFFVVVSEDFRKN